MTLHIPFEVVGTPIGVERDGGVLDVLVHDIPVEILPKDVIEKIVVDISELEINSHILAKDIKDKLPESANYLLEDEELLVTITKPGASIEELEAKAESEEETLEPEVIEESSEEE
jgi:large subunit ribosomal protein L25